MPRGLGGYPPPEYKGTTIKDPEPKADASASTGGGSWGTDASRGVPRSRDSYGGPASPNYKTHKMGSGPIKQKGTSNPESEDSMPSKKTRGIR